MLKTMRLKCVWVVILAACVAVNSIESNTVEIRNNLRSNDHYHLEALSVLPTAKVTGLELKKLTRDSVELLANVSVHNPLLFPIPITDINFNLTSGGRELVSGNVRDAGWLRARGETVVDVTMSVPYKALINLGRDIFGDWDIDYELKIGLILHVPVFANFTIPLSKTGQLKLPSLFKHFVKLT